MDNCWLWAGHKNKYGYGVINIKVAGKWRRLKAHREVYRALKGNIPDDLVCDHLCRITACINPEHIELVPSRVNVLRGVGASATHARLTHCHKGHPLTPDNLYKSTRGWRICKTCRKAWRRARRTQQ